MLAGEVQKNSSKNTPILNVAFLHKSVFIDCVKFMNKISSGGGAFFTIINKGLS